MWQWALMGRMPMVSTGMWLKKEGEGVSPLFFITIILLYGYIIDDYTIM
jgi:hypothetical protein